MAPVPLNLTVTVWIIMALASRWVFLTEVRCKVILDHLPSSPLPWFHHNSWLLFIFLPQNGAFVNPHFDTFHLFPLQPFPVRFHCVWPFHLFMPFFFSLICSLFYWASSYLCFRFFFFYVFGPCLFDKELHPCRIVQKSWTPHFFQLFVQGLVLLNDIRLLWLWLLLWL